jgi:hypothetical protein
LRCPPRVKRAPDEFGAIVHHQDGRAAALGDHALEHLHDPMAAD